MHRESQRRPLITSLFCIFGIGFVGGVHAAWNQPGTVYIQQPLPDHELRDSVSIHTTRSAPIAMDIPAHILEAVTTASDLPHPPRIPSAKSSLRKSRSEPRFARTRSARSSTENLSTSSDSEQEHGYQTDFTSIPSEAPQEDMQPDDVEDFREREYPQLKGKTYLDHGGTTVGRRHSMAR